MQQGHRKQKVSSITWVGDPGQLHLQTVANKGHQDLEAWRPLVSIISDEYSDSWYNRFSQSRWSLVTQFSVPTFNNFLTMFNWCEFIFNTAYVLILTTVWVKASPADSSVDLKLDLMADLLVLTLFTRLTLQSCRLKGGLEWNLTELFMCFSYQTKYHCFCWFSFLSVFFRNHPVLSRLYNSWYNLSILSQILSYVLYCVCYNLGHGTSLSTPHCCPLWL